MRLLHARTVQLRGFEENAIPPYAILSHTWGDGEVSFQDIQGPDAASKTGFKKIKYVCEHALEEGLEYVWIDTCCIDKTSSAELSEAINSMFRWYQKARYCYAYLDVPDLTWAWEAGASAFASSRWFTRGWTLQELLAPADLRFFSSSGRELGSKQDLRNMISKITSIDERYLNGKHPLSQASIAKRMSWASRRKTTRTEDLAYCLLGIFDISMPLLYGEGEKAFIRLQEEIMKKSDDQSLFAWEYNTEVFPNQKSLDSMESFGPFARHPSAFMNSGHYVPDELEPPTAYSLTNQGVQINLRVQKRSSPVSCPVAILACRPEERLLWLIGIPIRFHSEDSFMRLDKIGACWLIPRDEVVNTPYRSLRFLTNHIHLAFYPQEPKERYSCLIRKVPRRDTALHMTGSYFSLWNVEPCDAWDPEQRTISLADGDERHIVLRLWREKGDGYAIILDAIYVPHRRSRRWEYCVFQETCNQPRSYGFYARNERSAACYNDIWSSDIKINQGKNLRPPYSGNSFQIIDIELVRDATKPVDEPRYREKSKVTQAIEEMPRWRPRPPLFGAIEQLQISDDPVSE